ncbi:MAG: hypothetical protein IJ828_07095 [Treponema sp.]|nr:hypothetical protein [Treponema sp.]
MHDGSYTITMAWNSNTYDYLLLDGVRYNAVMKDGKSIFTIPISDIGTAIPIIADTVAMSMPHEIEYKMTVNLNGNRN